VDTPIGKRWHTREDSGLRLDRELRWWHDDEPIEHPKILEAFNQGLQPDDQGRFILRFGNDWCLVQVEDAAYWVQSLEVVGDQAQLSLSDRSAEPLVPESLALEGDGVLSCRVKAGRAKARFSRHAQFQLGERLVSTGAGVVLRLGGRQLPLSFDPLR
jgi:hypothetical protein